MERNGVKDLFNNLVVLGGYVMLCAILSKQFKLTNEEIMSMASSNPDFFNYDNILKFCKFYIKEIKKG